jgi:hypothetical protein
MEKSEFFHREELTWNINDGSDLELNSDFGTATTSLNLLNAGVCLIYRE